MLICPPRHFQGLSASASPRPAPPLTRAIGPPRPAGASCRGNGASQPAPATQSRSKVDLGHLARARKARQIFAELAWQKTAALFFRRLRRRDSPRVSAEKRTCSQLETPRQRPTPKVGEMGRPLARWPLARGERRLNRDCEPRKSAFHFAFISPLNRLATTHPPPKHHFVLRSLGEGGTPRSACGLILRGLRLEFAWT